MSIAIGRGIGGSRPASALRRMRFSLLLIMVLPLATAFGASLIAPRQTGAQEPAPFLKVDLVVPADVAENDNAVMPTDLCVYLPQEATAVTVSRRPLVPEAGGDRPLWMSIRPYVSTAAPIIDRANVLSSMTLTIPDLGYETCFSFENRVHPREALVAQAYKHFAQVVSLEVR